MRNLFFLALLFIALTACNNSKETSKTPENKQVNKEEAEAVVNELEVTMTFKTNKDAEIVFMMNDIKVDEFQTKNIHLFEKVIATSTADEFVGKFGANDISNKMIISLGNKEPKEFEILSIQFKHGNDVLTVTQKNIKKYFGFSKFSVLDTITNKIKTIKVDKAHYPRLYVRKKLWDDLKINL